MAPITPVFNMPDDVEVKDLLVERLDEVGLAPDTPVICINRGRKTLLDTFNAVHVTIPPGHFRTEYGAALHFQKRLIVPGTRNLEQGGFVSFIAILGSDNGKNKVDDEALCQPFTDEEMTRFGEPIEGIDRSALGGAAKDVQVISTQAARSQSRDQNASMRPQIGTDRQATPEAEAAADHVFEPPAESATREADAEAAAADPTRPGNPRRR